MWYNRWGRGLPRRPPSHRYTEPAKRPFASGGGITTAPIHWKSSKKHVIIGISTAVYREKRKIRFSVAF
jgi:hypothetical protein